MTYREKLRTINRLGIDICDLIIADELDSVLEFNYTDKEFEDLCKFSKNIYLEAESLTPNAIAKCINDLVNEEDKTVKEILTMDRWNFIGKASNYLD